MSNLFEYIESLDERLGNVERYGPPLVSIESWAMHVSPNTVFYAPIVSGDADDKSDLLAGHSFPGTPPTFVPGRSGKVDSALRFDYVDGAGADPWVFWAEFIQQRTTDDFSVAFKAYPFGPPPGGFAFLMGKGGFDSWNVIQENADGGTQISFSIWSSTVRNDFYSNVGVFLPNYWNSVLCTRRASDGLMRIYVNQEMVQTTAATGSFDTTTEPIIVGATYGNVGFNGIMSTMFVINRFLSHQEALAFALT